MAKRKSKKGSLAATLLILGLLLCGIVFSSVVVILVIGMLPTVVAAIVDTSKGHLRTLTVGSLNFAGCSPYMIDVWKRGGDINTAIDTITDPQAMVVMFFAAGMGYMVDWAMTGIVSSVMVQRAKGRLKEISQHQKILTERWGVEVSGSVPLDEYGFAKDSFTKAPVESTQDAPALKLP